MLGCISLFHGSASAHVLKVDREISTELHIEPDDNPISGRSNEYEFSFEDTSGRFSLSKCDCKFTVKQRGRTVTAQRLQARGPQESKNRYTFTSPGNYTLVISGQPKKSNDFQPFMMEFPERVAPEGGSGVQPFPLMLGIGLGAGMFLILLGAYKQNYDFVKKSVKK